MTGRSETSLRQDLHAAIADQAYEENGTAYVGEAFSNDELTVDGELNLEAMATFLTERGWYKRKAK